jgi:precorrin-6B methylase 2
MIPSRFFTRYAFIILSFAAVTGLSAQDNKANSEFVPSVGQKGKDVVWVPTPTELVKTMLDIAKVTPSDFLIDLGSGDGRTVIEAAKRGAHAVGIEFNPDMVDLSIKSAKKEGVSDKTEFLNMDLFEYDLSKATVITMFLLPEINLKLRPRILDLKPGTRIVSNTFTMGEWEADYEVTTEDNWNSWNNALMWIVPAKVQGIWKLGKADLEITQYFQRVSGTYNNGTQKAAIMDGKLSGDAINFTINGDKYTGQVQGNTMKGTVTNAAKGNTSDWVATR